MSALGHVRITLCGGTAALLLAACTSAAPPSAQSMPAKDAAAAQTAPMEKKDAVTDGAMMDKKEGAMEPAMAAQESGAIMEKNESAPAAAVMEKTEGAMEPAMAAKESGAMMEKNEGAPDAAMMEKTEGMMTDQKEGGAMQTQAGATPRKLPDQRLSPHFVVSSPKHGETLAKAPERIQINFDFTLHESSAIAVTRNDAPVQIGAIPVNPRGLVLAATLAGAGDGLYVVGYKACWPDRSCHDGQFAFTVQR